MKQIITGKDYIVGPWVCEKTGGNYSPVDSCAIGLAENGMLIAGVLYDHWNGATCCMHVAGEGKKWLNREYLWFCFHYAFEQLGAKKVIGMVSSSNLEALKFDKHLGFIHEATIRDGCKDGDLFLLTMTPEQCRWLKLGDQYGRKI